MQVNSISFKADNNNVNSNASTNATTETVSQNQTVVSKPVDNTKTVLPNQPKTDTVEIKKEEKNISTEKKEKKTESKKDIWQEIGMKEPSPIVIGLGSGALWFGIGALMDKGISKIWKGYQYNAKTSMYINGAFGVVMGIMDYLKAKKSN